ncbi:hypothetical protein HELRODRAFT_192639 [Helobdella robusta]|uniref:Uncharacterized protein n=1 Tax=Helobdella robusta TaxID=6412 RepID=T1FU56_HELRO|nr:hypothetical protein HELRODRAFT_192639 [Helobdella robusta]ESO00291.1 hypothetical protein HELRODRAFT_192639 [Helobdella robusta]
MEAELHVVTGIVRNILSQESSFIQTVSVCIFKTLTMSVTENLSKHPSKLVSGVGCRRRSSCSNVVSMFGRLSENPRVRGGSRAGVFLSVSCGSRDAFKMLKTLKIRTIIVMGAFSDILNRQKHFFQYLFSNIERAQDELELEGPTRPLVSLRASSSRKNRNLLTANYLVRSRSVQDINFEVEEEIEHQVRGCCTCCNIYDSENDDEVDEDDDEVSGVAREQVAPEPIVSSPPSSCKCCKVMCCGNTCCACNSCQTPVVKQQPVDDFAGCNCCGVPCYCCGQPCSNEQHQTNPMMVKPSPTVIPMDVSGYSPTQAESKPIMPCAYRSNINVNGFIPYPGQPCQGVPIDKKFVWSGAQVQPYANAGRLVFNTEQSW